MKNKTPFTIILLITSIFVLAACGGQATPTRESLQLTQDTPTSEVQQAVSGMSIAKSVLLDPALAVDADSQMIVVNVYETLVKMQDNAPVPSLAISAIPSQDGLEYTINLRPGVKFHDGSPLNADAVIANFSRWFDPTDPARGSGTYDAWLTAFNGFKDEVDADGKAKSTFDGGEKVDETTILLHLNTPDPDFLTKLTNPAFSIVNPTALNAAEFGMSAGKDGGTGPYMISTFTDSSLTLTPFADYWNPSTATSGNMEFSLSK
ncbi:MAG TPA: ABC transporter substrate-binding protein [Anaerolineales bacterium]|nr:ABC transporter substrate-binding protein [Anaerolineales bacterium]